MTLRVATGLMAGLVLGACSRAALPSSPVGPAGAAAPQAAADSAGARAQGPAATSATGPVVPPQLPEGGLSEEETRVSRAPRLGQEELRTRFTEFPRAITQVVPMGEQMVAHQIPMTLAYFETRADALEILEFYAEDFERRGWSRSGLKDAYEVIDHPGISATDPDDFTQISVVVVGNGRGEPNTVILALADVRPDARVSDEGELAPYPGTSPIVLRAGEVAGDSNYTQSFLTPDPVNVVVEFYLRRMPKLGFEVVHAGVPEGSAATELLFAKAGRMWRIRVSQQKGQTMVMAVGSAREEGS